MEKKSKWILIVAILLALPILPAIAGGAAEGPEPIRLGTPIYLSGEFSTDGQADAAVQEFEINKINEIGVAGTTIKAITLDTKCDASEEIKAIKSLVTGSKVHMVLAQLSEAIPPTLSFMREHKVPIATASAGTVALDETDKWFWRFCPSDSVAGAARAVFAFEEYGDTKIALIYSEREGPKLDALACKDYLIKLGKNIAIELPIVPEQTSYKETIRKLQSEGIETIVVAFMTSTAIQFFKDSETLGFRPNIIGSNDISSKDIVEAVGGYMEGAMAAFGGYDGTTKWFKQWEASVPMAEWEAKGLVKPGSGELIYATYHRDALVGLALAFERAGSTDPEKIMEAIPYVCNPPGIEVGSYEEGAKLLREGKDINFQGASGPIDFNKYGNVMAAGTVNVVKNGEWVQLRMIPAEEIAAAVGWE
jgi:ABC-type branched-subunit amino acid transport system substrate-binding protein